jgi:hypothetical protein
VLGSSIIRLVVLASLIVSIALAFWLLGADRVLIVVGVLAAWLIASMIEWLAWRRAEARRRRHSTPASAGPSYPARIPDPQPSVLVPPPAPASDIAEPIVVAASAELVPEPAEPLPLAESRARRRRPAFRLHRTADPATEPESPPVAPEDMTEPKPELAGQPEIQPVPEPDPDPAPEPDPEPTRPQIAAVPPLPPEPPAEPVQHVRPRVVRIPTRGPRQWNVWELDRLARSDPESRQAEERALLLLHLREHADANGTLPFEFDALVWESFGRLLAGVEPA